MLTLLVLLFVPAAFVVAFFVLRGGRHKKLARVLLAIAVIWLIGVIALIVSVNEGWLSP